MHLRRRTRRRARAIKTVDDAVTRSGPAETIQGAGSAGRAAGRSGKAMAAYTVRKARGKRAPLLTSLPLFAGASIASVHADGRRRRARTFSPLR